MVKLFSTPAVVKLFPTPAVVKLFPTPAVVKLFPTPAVVKLFPTPAVVKGVVSQNHVRRLLKSDARKHMRCSAKQQFLAGKKTGFSTKSMYVMRKTTHCPGKT